MRYKKLVPKCFSVAFILRFGPRYDRVLKALVKMVERDLLEGGYFAGTPAPEHALDHTYRILSMTLMRELRLVPGTTCRTE